MTTIISKRSESKEKSNCNQKVIKFAYYNLTSVVLFSVFPILHSAEPVKGFPRIRYSLKSDKILFTQRY